MDSQFGSSSFECPTAELYKFNQIGSIFDYYLNYFSLANRSNGLTNEDLLNCFVGGLHRDIYWNVMTMNPH